MNRFWIVVASRDHANAGKENGIIQACHGKKAPLRRMREGDWVLIYSSKETFAEKKACRKFTAIGRVSDERIFSFQMSPDFIPFRRRVSFCQAREVEILPMVSELDFIPNKKSWGFPFRFGILEIGETDFRKIANRMGVDVEG
ncbi:EVE domain protein [Leptospira inadai serovar Lyme str. 10]|uniref:UPF0310 protein LEP1GSC047_3190 n=2 Tax=Leptospira inadai serovar Lyme TaxID=293084 RepID=V6HAM7_9LEPT|nr:EVE domain-containing protein [Leptospira inadai]EQA36282.1 EVE domain protein [Leptospira inadai serovar Lyme str. 10]PNV74473.1 EVE domain-containing protein [Leptospira inadai serovar Lyme]